VVGHHGSTIRRTTSQGEELAIGPVQPRHFEHLFSIFEDVVERGDGYPQTPPLTRQVFVDTWFRPVTVVVGAVIGAQLVGAYYLKPNQPGLGAHIANAGYVVERSRRGRGIGTLLVEDSITRARSAGFDAIQFNLVFETNPARSLYERLGWSEVGRVPGAVRRAEGAVVPEDAIIYWRSLDDGASSRVGASRHDAGAGSPGDGAGEPGRKAAGLPHREPGLDQGEPRE
jgi:GNAT superfamily N-acetyltransferase